jgi:MarR family transcriptional regulator, organic hydroperoxide resistance regulator
MNINLNESLGFLIVQVCRAHRNKAQELRVGIGLYPGQEFLLLNVCPARGFTQTELAERLGVRPATLTRMLDRMENAGFVERRPDASDWRVTRIHTTALGGSMQEPILSLRSELDQLSFEGFNKEDVETLVTLLGRVLKNLS